MVFRLSHRRQEKARINPNQGRLQLNFRLLGKSEDLHPLSLLPDDAPTILNQTLQGRIGPLLVVVEDPEGLDLGLQGQPEGVGINRVAPGSGLAILFFRELGVMD
jgi:hypothetical protein